MEVLVFGAGNILIFPQLLAAVATYFGERELTLILVDGSEERVDLADRLGRALFVHTNSAHRLRAQTDLIGIEADAAILCMGEREVFDYEHPRGQRPTGFRPSEWAFDAEVAEPEPLLSRDADADWRALKIQRALALSSSFGGIDGLDWPTPLDMEADKLPHAVLRWIRSDEPLDGLLEQVNGDVLKAWLDQQIQWEMGQA